jgi:CheY-like chemotaxis protein
MPAVSAKIHRALISIDQTGKPSNVTLGSIWMQKWRFEMSNPKNNLLVVEDDTQLRILLSAILTQRGYRVRTAEDGFSALELMRADMPDLILSDLYMLGMSGFELLSVVRRRFPEVTVIAMSSAFADGQIPAGVAADAFYQKATGVPALLQVMEETTSPDSMPLAARYRDLAPIWIATHPPKSGAAEPVDIACPECLRTSHCIPGDAATIVRSTDCAYCRTPIQYAMVQTTDPGPPRELWVRSAPKPSTPVPAWASRARTREACSS